MKKKLPTFEFVIDDSEESGVKAISIVDDPAFQSSLVAFEKPKPKFVQFVDNKGKKKQICAGLSLIPNVLVYRVDPKFGEYYGYFSAETIEKIVEKYHEELNTNKVNLNHDANKYINAYMVSDYIVDSPEKVADLKRMGIEHENIMGSWFTAFKIKDPQVFEQIVNGNQKTGFSVEAFLDTFLVQAHNQLTNKKIKAEMKKNNKTLLEKIISLFKDEIFERALISELGFEIEWQEVGQPVNKVVVDTEGNETLEPLGAGEFKTDMGIIVTDEASMLVEIRELPEETEEPVIETEESDELKLPEDENVVPSGDTETKETMAEYPWDQCIEDQLAAGYDQTTAEKICGYIKEKNMSKEELTDEMLTELLGEENCLSCKQKKEEMRNQEFASLQMKFEEIKKEVDTLKSENETLKKENKELTDKVNAPIGEPILEPPLPKKEWAKMTAYERAIYQARVNM